MKGAFSQKTRDTIIRRARGMCEVCGLRVNYGQIHHRQPRGMGGTSSRQIESAANGIYLHARCHHLIEMNRERAYLYGHLVRNGTRPEDAQVKMHDGWWLLTPDGEKIPAAYG